MAKVSFEYTSNGPYGHHIHPYVGPVVLFCGHQNRWPIFASALRHAAVRTYKIYSIYGRGIGQVNWDKYAPRYFK